MANSISNNLGPKFRSIFGPNLELLASLELHMIFFKLKVGLKVIVDSTPLMCLYY